jgi:WD40 repeat protein
VADVAFSTDGSAVATASLDDTARVWSVADGRPQQTFPGHLTGDLAVVFLRGSPTIATVDGAESLKLWDLRSGRSLLDFPGSAGSPTDELVASPDGRMLLATGEDGGLRVWEASK